MPIECGGHPVDVTLSAITFAVWILKRNSVKWRHIIRLTAKKTSNAYITGPLSLCVSSYYQSRCYQPKMTNDIRDENVYTVFLQPPCTFRDVFGVQLKVNNMYELYLHVFIEGFFFLGEIGLFNFWPVTDGFPSQRDCNAGNVSMPWLHHVSKRPTFRKRHIIFFNENVDILINNDCEKVHFTLLSSSNRKYESLAVVWGTLAHETMARGACLAMFFWFKFPIDNESELVQLMAWHRTEHYMNQRWPSQQTHIYAIRSQ